MISTIITFCAGFVSREAVHYGGVEAWVKSIVYTPEFAIFAVIVTILLYKNRAFQVFFAAFFCFIVVPAGVIYYKEVRPKVETILAKKKREAIVSIEEKKEQVSSLVLASKEKIKSCAEDVTKETKKKIGNLKKKLRLKKARKKRFFSTLLKIKYLIRSMFFYSLRVLKNVKYAIGCILFFFKVLLLLAVDLVKILWEFRPTCILMKLGLMWLLFYLFRKVKRWIANGNGGKGGNAGFARQNADHHDPVDQGEEYEQFVEEERLLGGKAVNLQREKPKRYSGFSFPNIQQIATPPPCVSPALHIGLLALELGVLKPNIPRFVMAYQYIQKEIVAGRMTPEYLARFRETKGYMLLPGEKLSSSTGGLENVAARIRFNQIEDNQRKRIESQRESRKNPKKRQEEAEKRRRDEEKKRQKARKAHRDSKEARRQENLNNLEERRRQEEEKRRRRKVEKEGRLEEQRKEEEERRKRRKERNDKRKDIQKENLNKLDEQRRREEEKRRRQKEEKESKLEEQRKQGKDRRKECNDKKRDIHRENLNKLEEQSRKEEEKRRRQKEEKESKMEEQRKEEEERRKRRKERNDKRKDIQKENLSKLEEQCRKEEEEICKRKEERENYRKEEEKKRQKEREDREKQWERKSEIGIAKRDIRREKEKVVIEQKKWRRNFREEKNQLLEKCRKKWEEEKKSLNTKEKEKLKKEKDQLLEKCRKKWEEEKKSLNTKEKEKLKKEKDQLLEKYRKKWEEEKKSLNTKEKEKLKKEKDQLLEKCRKKWEEEKKSLNTKEKEKLKKEKDQLLGKYRKKWEEEKKSLNTKEKEKLKKEKDQLLEKYREKWEEEKKKLLDIYQDKFRKEKKQLLDSYQEKLGEDKKQVLDNYREKLSKEKKEALDRYKVQLKEYEKKNIAQIRKNKELEKELLKEKEFVSSKHTEAMDFVQSIINTYGEKEADLIRREEKLLENAKRQVDVVRGLPKTLSNANILKKKNGNRDGGVIRPVESPNNSSNLVIGDGSSFLVKGSHGDCNSISTPNPNGGSQTVDYNDFENGTGNGGPEEGGNEEDPFLVEDENGKEANWSKNSNNLDFLSSVGPKLSKQATYKITEVSEKMVNDLATNSSAVKSAQFKVSWTKGNIEKAKKEVFLLPGRRTRANDVIWKSLGLEKFGDYADPHPDGLYAKSYSSLIEPGVKKAKNDFKISKINYQNTLKSSKVNAKKTLEAKAKTEANVNYGLGLTKQFAGGVVASMVTQGAVSSAMTTFSIACGKNDAYNKVSKECSESLKGTKGIKRTKQQLKNTAKKTKVFVQEAIKEAPSAEEVGKSAIKTTAGAMIGQIIGGSIGAVAFGDPVTGADMGATVGSTLATEDLNKKKEYSEICLQATGATIGNAIVPVLGGIAGAYAGKYLCKGVKKIIQTTKNGYTKQKNNRNIS